MAAWFTGRFILQHVITPMGMGVGAGEEPLLPIPMAWGDSIFVSCLRP